MFSPLTPIARASALGDICLLDMVERSQAANAIERIAAAMFVWTVFISPLAFDFGCGNAAIQANQREVQSNQALIEQNQQEIAMLQANQGAVLPPTSIQSGGCDKKVEATATRRAGDAYANGNMTKALGYYQDALTACPGSSKAALNLGRTDEAMSNRETAIRYYRQAAGSTDGDTASIADAKAALSRLGVK